MKRVGWDKDYLFQILPPRDQRKVRVVQWAATLSEHSGRAPLAVHTTLSAALKWVRPCS